jgi:3-hydroxy-9,10-secoandrosta-1,3,5(10)-triene-9,17-dione monooxygenase reductase component
MPSTEEFKKSLSRFASGVTIVTYSDEKIKGGITVSSFSSLSIDPPLILFNINKSTPSHEKLISSSHFAVHILSTSQEDLSNQFSSSKTDKNEILNSISSETISSCPIIPGSLSVLVCENHKCFEGGDHSIFLGKIISVMTDENKEPLLYFNRAYHTLK